jgi:hypothetical protein
MDRKFYSLLFKQEAVAATSYCHIFFLIAFFEEAFIRNIILTLIIKLDVIVTIMTQ